jgi:hypothetical protein
VEKISVGDGFRFGCGFLLASLIAWLVVAIIGGILTALFGAALGGIFQRIGDLSLVPQILLLI